MLAFQRLCGSLPQRLVGSMITCESPVSDPPTTRPGVLTLHAPGRLHLGFLDPAATLGRPFGSLGLVIEGFETVVELQGASVDSVTGVTAAAIAETGRARAHLALLREHTGCRDALALRLLQVLPAHAGFGSGTQLALAIGRAFVQWFDLQVDNATLAGWLGRGQRSGIGIAGFDQGGLLLDGGPGADGTPAPLLARLPLPAAWRVLVVQDTTLQGLSGAHEKQAIAALPPLPQAVAADICHQVLMRVLPGAASADFASFAAGLTQVQALLGAHFAPAQGGSAYTSAVAGQLVQWIAEACRGRSAAGEEKLHGAAVGEAATHGAAVGEAATHGAAVGEAATHGAAVGQSSWGPTAFVILPSAAAAEAAVLAARAAGLVRPGLVLQIVRARNHGATLSHH
jgi:beta-ribofuranosylaminobenzene 5'-phosphate synthase